MRGKEWNKGRRRSGKALDCLRLAMALVIALFGLIAGAKSNFSSDVLPALLAIFMVGFGADQIKNLLTQKTPGTETSTSRQPIKVPDSFPGEAHFRRAATLQVIPGHTLLA